MSDIKQPKAENHIHNQFCFRSYAEEVCTKTFKIPNNKFALRLYGSYKAIGMGGDQLVTIVLFNIR